MKFDDYCQLILSSLEEEGYDNFMPSLLIPGQTIEVKVLEAELTDAGEEATAKDWAAAFGRGKMYLAYRSGNMHVDICEIVNKAVINKVRVRCVLAD